MTPELPPDETTPLNLTLHGSAGGFQIESDAGGCSLEVRYFLTNVGLDFGQGTNDALLSELAPVREVFRLSELGFDELMQRDIDDARVTSELIPYLLDSKTAGMVELFPPIVVALLPVKEGTSLPSPLYPSVWQGELPGEGFPRYVIRAGSRGRELFELEQPSIDGRLLDHDRVRLRINTHGTRLVIVDGQHRAMALLALFRNVRDQWSDERRSPYRDYYAEWTPTLISGFKLQQVQLPVMICLVPELSDGFDGDYDLIRSARRIFLTLNKTARKVSDSRNRLLDDDDLIAVFLRRVLESVKDRQDASQSALKIWGVELDQASDRTRVQDRVALTGVNHVYYVIEHLMLNSQDTHGIGARPGRFASLRKLDSCLARLDGRDLLGAAVADSIRRDSFATADADQLATRFEERYGRFIIRMFDSFGPYAIQNTAATKVQSSLLGQPDSRLQMMLFEGQGFFRTFNDHREIVDRRLAGTPEGDPEHATLLKLSNEIDELSIRLATTLTQLEEDRSGLFVANALPEGDPPTPTLRRAVNDLYQNYFTSVAFQAALMATFFGEIERVLRRPGASMDTDSAFSEYILQLSQFFLPVSKNGLERLLRVFSGEIVGSQGDPWATTPSDNTFRQVVFRGEMQPDQFPKVRYLMLELWQPKDASLAMYVRAELILCREKVVSSLFRHQRAELARNKGVSEDELSPEELKAISDRSVDSLSALIRNLGGRDLDKELATKWALGPPQEPTADEDPSADE